MAPVAATTTTRLIAGATVTALSPPGGRIRRAGSDGSPPGSRSACPPPGFDEEEARNSIECKQTEFGADSDLFSRHNETRPTFTYMLPADRCLVSELKGREGIVVREVEGGTLEIVVGGYVDAELEKTIMESLPEAERGGFKQAIATYRAQTRAVLSPAERGEVFAVPRLIARVQGVLEFADTDVFLEDHDWSLRDHSWKPGEDEFNVRKTARSFEIDLDGSRIAYQFATAADQLALDIDVEGWTPEALVLWLDRHVRQQDIGQGDLLGWLSGLVNHLTVSRGIHIAALMRCKFILARKACERISAIRQSERECVYQRHLFAPDAKPEVSFDHAFTFRTGMYCDQRRYRGHWKPSKHFLGSDRVPAFDGAENGEEFRCAQVIDSLPGLRFWIRNVARHRHSFWLPTASGKFFPDFVAMLEDGRLLVVEYKGAHIADGSDTAGKRAVGTLWERQSDGKGVFVLAEKSVNGKDTRLQILERLRQSANR